MQAERLVSKFEELGAVTGDLGLSAIKLAKFEDSDGSRCGTYTDSAMASKNISADSKRVGMVSPPRQYLSVHLTEKVIACCCGDCTVPQAWIASWLTLLLANRRTIVYDHCMALCMLGILSSNHGCIIVQAFSLLSMMDVPLCMIIPCMLVLQSTWEPE